MPTCAIRSGRTLLVAAILLAGCGGAAEETFKDVGADLVPVPSTATTAPAPTLIPYVGDGFTISLPGQADVQSTTARSAAGPVETKFVTSKPDARTEYGVTYNSAPYKGTKTIDLDAAARGAATDAQGTLAGMRSLTYKGHPGRDFRIDGAVGQSTIFVRLMLVERRTIVVMAVFDGAQTAAPDLYRQVLESLTFTG